MQIFIVVAVVDVVAWSQCCWIYFLSWQCHLQGIFLVLLKIDGTHTTLCPFIALMTIQQEFFTLSQTLCRKIRVRFYLFKSLHLHLYSVHPQLSFWWPRWILDEPLSARLCYKLHNCSLLLLIKLIQCTEETKFQCFLYLDLL